MRFSIKLVQPNNIIVLLFLAAVARLLPATPRSHFVRINKTLCRIYEGDVFASIAGGDSFADIYGLQRLFYVTLPQILIILLGKKLMQMPQTYGPFASPLARSIARFILRRSETVYARDKTSLEVATKLGARNPRFLYDVAFCLAPQAPASKEYAAFIAKLKKHPTIVGLNVSGLLYVGGYSGKNMFGLKADYRKLIADFIDYFTKELRTPVLLVPHVFGETNGESDTAACGSIYKENSDNSLLFYYDGYLNQNEVKHLIGHCSFFAGSRMHACIAALSQGIPAVGLAYSRKFAGVLGSIGLDNLAFNLKKLQNGTIAKGIACVYSDIPAHSTLLKYRIGTIQSTIQSVFH